MPDAGLTDNVSFYTSTFHDTYVREQVVTTCTSATRPSGVEGRHIYETDTDRVMVYDGTSWVQVNSVGAWTSYTPTVSQGASTNIAKTVNYSNYARHGRMITWTFRVSMSASGTAGSAFTLTLPVTAASTSGIFGAGFVADADASTGYVCAAAGASTTTVVFYSDGVATSGWGAAPNVALAASDEIFGSITYEAAS